MWDYSRGLPTHYETYPGWLDGRLTTRHKYATSVDKAFTCRWCREAPEHENHRKKSETVASTEQEHVYQPVPTDPTRCARCEEGRHSLSHQVPEQEHPFQPLKGYVNRNLCAECGEGPRHSVHNGRGAVASISADALSAGLHEFTKAEGLSAVCAKCMGSAAAPGHLPPQPHRFERDSARVSPFMCRVCCLSKSHSSHLYGAAEAIKKIGTSYAEAAENLKANLGVTVGTFAKTEDVFKGKTAMMFLSDGKGGTKIEHWTPEFQEKVAKAVMENPDATDPAELIEKVREAERVASETEAAEAAYGCGMFPATAPAAEGFEKVVQDKVLEAFELQPGDIGLLGPTSEEVRRAERIADLKEWWSAQSADDVEMVAEKAVTYGSNSLEQLGRKMAQLKGRFNISSEEAQELGCWINAVQKMERWTDAVMRGERPKDDSILDLVAYGMMVRRIRDSGGWPDGQG